MTEPLTRAMTSWKRVKKHRNGAVTVTAHNVSYDDHKERKLKKIKRTRKENGAVLVETDIN